MPWNLKRNCFEYMDIMHRFSTSGQNLNYQRQQLWLDYVLSNEMSTATGIWLLLEWFNEWTEIAAD